MKKIMKRTSNFVEKLTLKQFKIIMGILTIGVPIFLIAFWAIYPNNVILSMFFAISAVISAPTAYYVSVIVGNKKFLEEEKILRPKVRKEFCFDSGEFVEIIPLPTASKKWLILSIEKNAKFFAKEVEKSGEEEKIILIIKDENNEQLKEPIEVTNYYAFYNSFKLKK